MFFKTPLLFFLFVLPVATEAFSQKQLGGSVTSGKKEEAVPFAIIFWEGTLLGTAADSLGTFRIAWPDSFPATLVIRAIGYIGKSLYFTGKEPVYVKVNLALADTLTTVTIEERRDASEFSSIQPYFVERITEKGLRKAACCNLSESFETNPTVDASATDAVSGAKKIQLLGLDGVYSQILFENLPLIRGLSSSYGLSYVPGTWVKGILITKGTGSVVNGYESIAGQLNIDFLKPELEGDQELLFANIYASHRGRLEANMHFNRRFGKYWGTTLLTHASRQQMRNDMNGDGFLDMPLYNQVNMMNRWTWQGKKFSEGQFGVRFVYDDRTGGQTGFEKSRDYLTTNFYGIGIKNRQAEFFNKTGFVFPAPARSIGTLFSARWHSQEMYFGVRQYSGEQRSIYGNIIYEDMLGNTNHLYKAGLSLVYDEYDETFLGTKYQRTEIVPGAFFEYTGHLSKKFTMVAGIRADAHNVAGFHVSPRLHMKYDLTPKTILRASGGKGFRTANIFTENTVVFASSSQLIIQQNLKAEVAWNYGGSLQRTFTFRKRDATLIIDFFRTDFDKQVVVDREETGVVVFYNLTGKSYANSFQTDLLLEPIERFDIRVAYKFYDVQTTYDGILKFKPLTARHRAFINLAYALPHDKWTFDFTTKWIGSTRLPGKEETFSKPYYLLSSNISRSFRKFALYGGAENILNYRQPQPILAPEAPFGPDFDASRVYGPTDGLTIYAGLRFKL